MNWRRTGKAKHSSLLPSPSTPDAMAIANFCKLGHLGGAAASSSQKLLICDLQTIAGDLEGGGTRSEQREGESRRGRIRRNCCVRQQCIRIGGGGIGGRIRRNCCVRQQCIRIGGGIEVESRREGQWLWCWNAC
jgi:hypothetical protein